jgi:ribosomal protein S18 acetylase RimI-like enzyme
MQFKIRRALPADAAACVALRGRTRENAISPERLRAYGITVESWASDIATDTLAGHVCCLEDKLVGYCLGARLTGAVVVLALLPEAECMGLGRRLLALVIQDLRSAGHSRLFLGCSPDPAGRSYGFYRHLGWRSTATFDRAGDEILESVAPAERSANA